MNQENPNLNKMPGDDIKVICSSGISRHKTKVLKLKLSAPKEMFSLTDALARHGNFQSVEDYLSKKVVSLLADYLGRAEEVAIRASELSKSAKNNK